MSASKKKSAVDSPKSPVLPVARAWLDHHLTRLSPVLTHWVESGRIAPVWLLTGIAGVGKRELAYALSQWIFCERSPFSRVSAQTEEEGPGLFGGVLESAAPPEPEKTAPNEPGIACGECGECKKALHGAWVDFEEISPEGAEDEEEDGATDSRSPAASGALKIERFRELKASQGFGAYGGGYRVTLIRDADRMTPQAANSVLKLLEEPPPGWILILTAGDPSQLLPTLVSRCQSFRLQPLPHALIAELLREREIPSDRARTASELAQGSFRKALALAQDETWERRLQILKFLDTPHTEVNALVDWAAQGPQNLSLLLDQLEQALSELMRWSLNPEGHEFAQRALKPIASARKESPERLRRFWTERSEQLFRARQVASTPVNKKLLVQGLLLPFCGPF